MYGSYQSSQYIEVVPGKELQEVELRIALICTSRGDPGCMYMSNGDPGYPPEPAEFELDTVHVLDEEGKPIKINEDLLTVLMGQEAWERMFEDACVEAVESGEF